MKLSDEDARLFQKFLSLKDPFTPESYCFEKQLRFIQDPAKFKLALCSRRAGKTVGCAVDLIRTSLSKENQKSLYITLSRNNAKKIVWGDLVSINRDYDLGGKTNEADLSIQFKNGSVIYLSGANDKSEIEKFRGLALSLCYIDECQSFRSYIKELIDDVISKSLFDYNGTLCLTGTPAPTPTGYFYECYKSKQWSVHEWTMFDNPWIKKKSGLEPQELLDRELKRKGVTVEDPSIQREVFGRWCIDSNALVFRYDKDRNVYSGVSFSGPGWNFIIGVDIGFDDADAIAIIGWNDRYDSSYLVEELVCSKQGITELANQISSFIEKYDPRAVVMDTGGLGKKIAEEMNKRFSLPIKPAEKSRKFEYIELLNDALRTKKFHVEQSSRFAQDAMLVEWDKDSPNPKISDRYHSDITDAVIYAWRESLHWLYEAPEKIIKPYTDEWYKKQEKDILEKAMEDLNKKKSRAEGNFLFDETLSEDIDWY